MKTKVINGNRKPAKILWSLKVSQILVGLAFALTIVGNRWAGYIQSPIPGVPLPEFLLFIALITIVPSWRQFVLLRSWVLWTYGAVGVYVLIILLPELLTVQSEDRYLALRDSAPFLFMALVPFLAVALRSVSATTGIFIVRGATALTALGTLLVAFGVLTPFASTLLGSDFAMVFSYRSDLTGAALAIGMVAWGGWLDQQVKSQPVFQLTLVAIAGLVVTSRSGLVAVLVAVFVIAYQQRQWIRGLMLAGASLTILVLTIFISISGMLPVSPESPDSPVMTAIDTAEANERINDLTRTGTVMARLDTWADVITGMSENGTWLLGGSAGSDYLYELCTGIAVAPETVRAEFNDPKCAVDDHGPEPVVRDPHNWVLNIAITHGILGVILFSFALGNTLWRGRGSEIYLLAVWTAGFFLVTGFTFLISAGYALLPISVGMAWIVSRVGFRPSDASQLQG